MTCPALLPPVDDIYGRAVWHAPRRAVWRQAAALTRPRTAERRKALVWARYHEARIVDLAIRAEHNGPHHARP